MSWFCYTLSIFCVFYCVLFFGFLLVLICRISNECWDWTSGFLLYRSTLIAHCDNPPLWVLSKQATIKCFIVQTEILLQEFFSLLFPSQFPWVLKGRGGDGPCVHRMVSGDTCKHSGLCVLAVAVVLWVIWSDMEEIMPTRLRACREQTGTNDLHTHVTHQPYVSVCVCLMSACLSGFGFGSAFNSFVSLWYYDHILIANIILTLFKIMVHLWKGVGWFDCLTDCVAYVYNRVSGAVFKLSTCFAKYSPTI